MCIYMYIYICIYIYNIYIYTYIYICLFSLQTYTPSIKHLPRHIQVLKNPIFGTDKIHSNS